MLVGPPATLQLRSLTSPRRVLLGDRDSTRATARTCDSRPPVGRWPRTGKTVGMTLHADDYQASRSRYDSMTCRRTGRSALDLPAVALGLWHNFGDDGPLGSQRATLRRAFDLGVTHFD